MEPEKESEFVPLLELQRLEGICDRFEAAWKAGERPRVDEYLTDASEAYRSKLRRMLLALDLDYCQKLGELKTLEEFRAAYPSVEVDALAELFAKQSQRESAGAALSPDAAEAANLPDMKRTQEFDRSAPQPGTIIAGRYKLLEAIGQGGMGTVWVAEQTQPVRRKVALKLIKAGMDSQSVLARFEAERQALAVMDHPNIAKVLDGGLTDSGRPFFVMEYVKGVPITEYCEATRLSIPKRLELFVEVCQAVQHAHQKGIIHRDLKPSNILVAPYDDRPVPKVIDFGLAKAMHQPLTERTLHTAHETVLGTPLYMSPEQAQLNNLDVDTRSDLYSLGVLLYELLTGTTPVEKQRFRQAAWDEIRRIIREEEPPRPSMRLSSSDTLPSLAAGRQIEPARLTKLVRGELDWIVMKSLEKDRTRRYETANGFAQDIQRYLAGEPVVAAPPSARYRLRKFARKHQAALTTAVAMIVLLVTGSAVSIWQAVRATRAEAVSRTAEQEAKAKQAEAEQQKKRAVAGEKLAGDRLALVDAEKKKAEAANRQLQRQLVLPYIERGVNELEHGDPARGLAMLGQAYRAADYTNQPVLRRSAGALLSAWQSNCERSLVHDALVRAVVFSPDSTKVATASYDTTARLWDATTGQPLGAPMKHDWFLDAVAFSPDGTKVATVGGRTARLWNAATCQPLGAIMKHDGAVYAVVFSPDGAKLATASQDKTARFWDATTGQLLGQPMKHENPVLELVFSPDGTKIATLSPNSMFNIGLTARLWDAATCQQLGEPKKSVSKLVFSPDGTRVVTANGDSTARLWDASMSRPLGAIMKHDGAVYTVTFSPDGTKLATASEDKTARLWDAATGALLGQPMKHEGAVSEVVFSPDGRKLATTCEGSVQFWDITTCQPLGAPIKHPKGVQCAAFSPDGTKHAAVALGDSKVRICSLIPCPPLGHTMKDSGEVLALAFSPDGTKLATATSRLARQWDTTTCQPLGVPIKHTIEGFRSLAFSADGAKLAANDAAHSLRLWNTATGQAFGQRMALSNMVSSMVFSPDGTKLATVSLTARLWDAATGQSLGTLKNADVFQPRVKAVAFSPDGTKLATASAGGRAQLWDTATCQPVGAPMSHYGDVNAVVFSPDGKQLATAGFDKTARLWDVATCQAIGAPMKHSHNVKGVVYSPDGRTLATVSEDGICRLWEVDTGQPLGLPMNHGDRVVALVFSPDGAKIATGGWDKTARLWDAATGQPLGEPIQHEQPVWDVAFSPDGTKLATASGAVMGRSGEARLCPVPALSFDDPRSVTAFVEVISAWKAGAGGGLEPTSVAEADDAWREVLKSPAWLDQYRQEAARRARVWHESEASANEAASNWFAAAFHLRWLCRLEPKNIDLPQRLAKAEKCLAETTKIRMKESGSPVDK